MAGAAGRVTLLAALAASLPMAGTGATCPASSAEVYGRFGYAPFCGVGCGPIRLSAADGCKYDVSACSQLRAGTYCTVRCRAPYAGNTSLASCPAGNADPEAAPLWHPPHCDVEGGGCRVSGRVPNGYVQVGGAWRCAAGYGGIARTRCVPDAGCERRLELSGCLPLAPCIVPPIDLCQFNVSNCTEGVEAGSECSLQCKAPYEGTGLSVATCPADNTDPERSPLVDLASCSLRCEDPASEPEGYYWDNSTGWGCADGYVGAASWHCVIDDLCGARKVLTGCVSLKPCVLPEADKCMYDFSACGVRSASAGSSCPVACRRPYTGAATAAATCPADNTDPVRELAWEAPSCTLDCSETASTPVGYVSYPYVKTATGWDCHSGFAGLPQVSCAVSADCTPMLTLSGCFPLVPCLPPQGLSPYDICQYDIGDCFSVQSGDSCTVGCKAPFDGVDGAEEAVSACPADNILQGVELAWRTPECDLNCWAPGALPPGYLMPHSSWDSRRRQSWETGRRRRLWDGFRCAPGYFGEASAECALNNACQSTLEFSGCLPPEPCALPADGTENCLLDWSDCSHPGRRSPGSACTLRCKEPYVGSTTLARCPSPNTNASEELEWEMPECTLRCADVDRQGYEKMEWACTQGYNGSGSARCTTGSGCVPQYKFDGCVPEVPCASLAPDGAASCALDVSNCSEVRPGESCEVRCAASYAGRPTRAFCPLGNTDRSRELLWVEPHCEPQCPDPVPSPAGYIHFETCGWQCSQGYTGLASMACIINSTTCAVAAELTGCQETLPCGEVVVGDPCRLDAASCTNLRPGASCLLPCQEPYTNSTDRPSEVECPADNLDPTQSPRWLSIEPCSLVCPDPVPIPAGYSGSGSSWECAHGYVGTAMTTCAVDADCVPRLTLSGCMRIIPCPLRLGAVDDCIYDVTACPINIQAGRSCTVSCKNPYRLAAGYSDGSASCPDENTEELALVWEPPLCRVDCGQASLDTNPGYIQKPWNSYIECAPGYIGTVVRTSCETDEYCIVRPVLSGCTQLRNCAPLVLQGEASCRVDASDCDAVAGGAQCVLTCRLPFVGQFNRPNCEAQNVDPTKQLFWTEPPCACPDPSPYPEGYTKNVYGDWICTMDYRGEVESHCFIALPGETVHDEEANTTFVAGPGCYVRLMLSGCQPLVPCATPALDEEGACRFDASNCSGVDAGATCNVLCLEPYVGNDTQGMCPPGNTNPLQAPIWDEDCHLECQRPNPEPAGYKAGPSASGLPRVPWFDFGEEPWYTYGYRCAEGFRGEAVATCVDPGCSAHTDTELAGCSPLAACGLPLDLSLLEYCTFDFSQCYNLQPGSFCDVGCKPGYTGSPGRALCPPDNTDPNMEVVWTGPRCDVDCPDLDPDAVPEGYAKTPCGGWRCAAGYVGTAVATCGMDQSCRPQLELSGCERLAPCVVPAAMVGRDSMCDFNFSDCLRQEIHPGESCELSCQAPFVGGATSGHCPAGNTNTGEELRWEEPGCALECHEPDSIPPGYVEVAGVWQCADGYIGSVVRECEVEPDECDHPHFHFEGCTRLAPCVAPHVNDTCMYDLSNCSEVPPGSSCEVHCLGPYVGEPTNATCPDDNFAHGRAVDWEPPECELECSDPDPPRGYVNLGTGGWKCLPATGENESAPCFDFGDGGWDCAEDAIGNATTHCVIDGNCSARLELRGCFPLEPCAPPGVDECLVNITSCMGLRPGEACTAECRPPFVGPDANASCPVLNVNTSQEPLWAEPPACACPEPTGPRPGYVRVADGWECEEGYYGNASVECVVGNDCAPHFEFAGCLQLVPCVLPSSGYLTEDCRSIPAGKTCTAQCLESGCIAGGPLVFECPLEDLPDDRFNIFNGQPRSPRHISGECVVQCEVCGALPFVDTNPREGVIGGVLHFGPAHAGGSMDIADIVGFRVFLVDSCGARLSELTNLVPPTALHYECCVMDAYEVPVGPLSIDIRSELSFEIIVTASHGDLPMGLRVALQDRTPDTIASAEYEAGAASRAYANALARAGARRASAMSRAGALLVGVTAAANLLTA